MKISRSVQRSWDKILRGHEVQGLRNEEGTLLWVPEEYGRIRVLRKADTAGGESDGSHGVKVRPELPELVIGGYASPQVVDKEKHLITKEAMTADLPRFLAHPHYRNVMVVHCAVAGTRVRVGPNSYKRIENIRLGERVYTHRARLRTVKAATRHEGPAVLVRVELANGEVLKLTVNHRLLTTVGWVRAEHLTTGHVLNHLEGVGRKQAPEARTKNSLAHSGRTHTLETRARMSKDRMGHAVSEETKARISATQLGNAYALGYRHTEGAKAAISAALSVPVGTRRLNKGTGYMMVRTEAGWEKESRIIAGLEPGDGLVAHHRDEDPLNNEPANIQVFESQAEHARHHAEARVKVANGVGIRSVLFVPNSEPVYNLEVEEDSSYAGLGCIHHNTNIQVGEVLPEWTHPETGEVYKTQVDDIGLFAVVKVRTDPFRPAIIDQVIKDIESGELSAFSISGDAPYESRQYQCSDGSCFWVINEIEHYEITICQKGVNQDARYAILSKAAFCQGGGCPVRLPTERITLRTVRTAVARAEAEHQGGGHEGASGHVAKDASTATPPKPPMAVGATPGAAEGSWRTGNMQGGNEGADVGERAGSSKSMTDTNELFTAEEPESDEHTRAVNFLWQHGRSYVAGVHPTRRASLHLGDGEVTVRLTSGRSESSGRYSADQVNEAVGRALKFVQTGGREHGPMFEEKQAPSAPGIGGYHPGDQGAQETPGPKTRSRSGVVSDPVYTELQQHDTPDSPHREHMGRGKEAREQARRERFKAMGVSELEDEIKAGLGSGAWRATSANISGQFGMALQRLTEKHGVSIKDEYEGRAYWRHLGDIFDDLRSAEGSGEEKAQVAPGIITAPHSQSPGIITQEETCAHGCYATVEDVEEIQERSQLPPTERDQPRLGKAEGNLDMTARPYGGPHDPDAPVGAEPAEHEPYGSVQRRRDQPGETESEEHYLNKAVDSATVVLCVVLDKGGFPVAGIRRDRKHGEAYEFPGGHVQVGETMRQASERELLEESGVEARAVRKLGEKRSPNDGVPVIFVQLEPTGGEPRDSSEMTDVRYWDPDEVRWAFDDSREMVDTALGGALSKGTQAFGGEEVPYGEQEESSEEKLDRSELELHPGPGGGGEDHSTGTGQEVHGDDGGGGSAQVSDLPRLDYDEVSPRGKRLLEKDAWRWTGDTGARTIREASEKLLEDPTSYWKPDKDMQAAARLFDAVRSGERFDKLYRGMTIGEDELSELLGELSAGDSHSLPLSSFSKRKGVANQFSVALKERGEVEVILQVEGAQGFPISEFAPAKFRGDAEVVVAGTFTVKSTSRAPSSRYQSEFFGDVLTIVLAAEEGESVTDKSRDGAPSPVVDGRLAGLLQETFAELREFGGYREKAEMTANHEPLVHTDDINIRKHTTEKPHPHGRGFGGPTSPGGGGPMEKPLGAGKFPWQRKVGKNCALCETERVLEQALDVREWRSTASSELRLMSRFTLGVLGSVGSLGYTEGRWFALAEGDGGLLRRGLAVELGSLLSMVGKHALDIGATDLWGEAFRARGQVDKLALLERSDAYQQVEDVLARMYGLRREFKALDTAVRDKYNDVVNSLLVLMTDYQVREEVGGFNPRNDLLSTNKSVYKGYGFGWYANAQRTLARAAGALRRQAGEVPEGSYGTALTAILDDIDQLEAQLGVTQEMEKGTTIHEEATQSELDIVREVAKDTEENVADADDKLEAVGARDPEPAMSGEPASALNDPAQQTMPENVAVRTGAPSYTARSEGVAKFVDLRDSDGAVLATLEDGKLDINEDEVRRALEGRVAGLHTVED